MTAFHIRHGVWTAATRHVPFAAATRDYGLQTCLASYRSTATTVRGVELTVARLAFAAATDDVLAVYYSTFKNGGGTVYVVSRTRDGVRYADAITCDPADAGTAWDARAVAERLAARLTRAGMAGRYGVTAAPYVH